MTDIPPAALYHTGYTSVYTVDSDSGHLRETYLPAIGDSWTSVFTSDLLSGALDETYLPALGSPWLTKVLP